MKTLATLILFFSFVTVTGILFSDVRMPGETVPGEKSITSDELYTIVDTLASPFFNGRLAGSSGYDAAADYAADFLRSLDITPKGDEGYFQHFTIEYNEISAPTAFHTISGAGVRKEYVLGEDYVFRGFTGAAEITAPVVFCGYGISEPELGYDDYEGIDVQGKIVMVFKYNPRWKYRDSIHFSGGTPRFKANTAADHGAAGILFLSLPNDKNPQPLIGSVAHGDGLQRVDFPQLHISFDAAAELLESTGTTLGELQAIIDSTQLPHSLTASGKVYILANSSYDPARKTKNIIGYIEGSNEKLKEEYVIVTGHLDHVGSQADEIYFPGANDNASGSAGVLQIAKAFKKSGINPARSVLFILFSAEESGLEGAEYYVQNPVLPLENAVAILNMDCIGSGDSLRIGNGKSTPKLWKFIRNIDQKNANLMTERTWGGGGADGTPFHLKGVPLAYCVTKNTYGHLHLLSDTPESLNMPLYTEMVKLVYRSAFHIAQGEYRREEIVVQ